MLDRHGIEVCKGDRVRFYYFNRWRNGTVRDLSLDRSKNEVVAKVDDGAFDNEDMRTNGFRVAAFIDAQFLELVRAG
jgi:hypothetical protein